MLDDGIKRGFSIPLTSWLQGDLSEKFKQNIASKIAVFDFLNPKATTEMLETHLRGEEDLKWPLFTLYSL